MAIDPIQKRVAEGVRIRISNTRGLPLEGGVTVLAFRSGSKSHEVTLPASDRDGRAEYIFTVKESAALRRGIKPSVELWFNGDQVPEIATKIEKSSDRFLALTIFADSPKSENEDAPGGEAELVVRLTVTDQSLVPVPDASVILFDPDTGRALISSPLKTDAAGRASAALSTSGFEMPGEDGLPSASVTLNGQTLQVIETLRLTKTARLQSFEIHVLSPGKEDPPEPDSPGGSVITDGGKDNLHVQTGNSRSENGSKSTEDAGDAAEPTRDGRLRDRSGEKTQRNLKRDRTDMSKEAKRLFRFNTVRPVAPQPDSNMGIEYQGELTPFLRRLQTLATREQARSLAAEEIAKDPFFKAARFQNTAYWPLISLMKQAYTMTTTGDVAVIKSDLAETLKDSTKLKDLETQASNVGDIWDDYVLSLLLPHVEDKKRAALVDCLKAVALLNARQTLRTADDFRNCLLRQPILPEWIVHLVGGNFRVRFPFVIGVSDLMVVKEQWIGYQRTEIAHIENVMATEERTTTRRQLNRTETTTTYESERIEEALKETATSTHSAISREVQSSISQSSSLSTGATVSAAYGPTVSVDTSASFDFTTASEQSASSAQEYAQDLVERAVSTVTSRERNETVTVVLSESEDTHVQTFKNLEPGAKHVIGVYRHIDQIWEAQVFNYGKRLMLDLVVPEPSINWRLSREEESLPDSKLKEPAKLNVNPAGIDVDNYQNLANTWGATNVPAPPDTIVSVSKALKLEVPKFGTGEATLCSMATDQIQIPSGYRGEEAVIQFFGDTKKENNDGKDDARIVISGLEKDIETSRQTVSLNNHVGTLEFGVYIDFFEGGVVSVRVDCRISPEAWETWQNSVYDALKAANDKAIDAYVAAKKSKDALTSVLQETLQTDIKRNIERMEVKRAAISMLASDNYEESGSIDLVRDGQVNFPSIRFEEARQEGAYARFFEEAFEWSEMTYLYYPYFWARRSEWFKLMTQRDPDYNFNAFLQSGAARVNLAVRPGFEGAVIWFLATGEVWKGGPIPGVGNPLYVALIDEIVERKGRDLDDPLHVGKPWTYAIPTTLVVLDPDDSIVPPSDGTVTQV